MIHHLVNRISYQSLRTLSVCTYQTLKSRTAGKPSQRVECLAELVQFVCEIKPRIEAGALTLVRLLLRRLMSEVINRMLVMHTKMSINCNQNQPRKQIQRDRPLMHGGGS